MFLKLTLWGYGLQSPLKILKALLPSSILATCPAHLNLLDLITLTILGERYMLFREYRYPICCVSLPTSFGDKGPHWRRWLISQPSSTVPLEVFRNFPQLYGTCQDICARPLYRLIITLWLADRGDWRDTRSKWHLTRNPNRSWWYRHSSLKLQLHGQQQATNILFINLWLLKECGRCTINRCK